jgi:hypothetical protein
MKPNFCPLSRVLNYGKNLPVLPSRRVVPLVMFHAQAEIVQYVCLSCKGHCVPYLGYTDSDGELKLLHDH